MTETIGVARGVRDCGVAMTVFVARATAEVADGTANSPTLAVGTTVGNVEERASATGQTVVYRAIVLVITTSVWAEAGQ